MSKADDIEWATGEAYQWFFNDEGLYLAVIERQKVLADLQRFVESTLEEWRSDPPTPRLIGEIDNIDVDELISDLEEL